MSPATAKMPSMLLLRALAKYPISRLERRFNSSQPQPAPVTKEVSRHISFYQVFARPIAKVLLMATLTYQLSYWFWVKLEKDEISRERTVEIRALEMKLSELVANKKGP